MAELFLMIIAKLLYWIFAPIGFLYAVPRMLTRMNRMAAWNKLREYWMALAISIDQKGNVIMQELFNDLLIKDRKNFTREPAMREYIVFKTRFGNPDETISSVLGKNKRNGTLTTTGKVLDWILETIDPNHSIKSIEEDEQA